MVLGLSVEPWGGRCQRGRSIGRRMARRVWLVFALVLIFEVVGLDWRTRWGADLLETGYRMHAAEIEAGAAGLDADLDAVEIAAEQVVASTDYIAVRGCFACRICGLDRCRGLVV